MKVDGYFVTGQVWIHFFIGDTAGFNTWLGHYNGSGKLKRQWRDCHCTFNNRDEENKETNDECENGKR